MTVSGIPPTIRVGPMDYAVKSWGTKAANNSGALGLCDPDNLTILIREGLHPFKEAEVLLHEVLHAAYSGAALREFGGNDPEEVIVSGLGFQLLQVWRDNPALVQYFEAIFRPDTKRKAA